MKFLKFLSLFLYVFLITPIFVLQKLKLLFLRSDHSKIKQSFWKIEK